MSNRAFSLRFSAEDGKVDIATAASILYDIQTVLDSSIERAYLWENAHTLMHSAKTPTREKPSLEARIDSVNDGSVEMLIDLAASGLLDPQAWYDTLAAFFSLASPFLSEMAHEIAKGTAEGIGLLCGGALGEAVMKRRSRFKTDKPTDEEPSSTAPSTEHQPISDDGQISTEASTANTAQDESTVYEDLLEDFFLDSKMLNAISRIVQTLDSDKHGLNFSLSVNGKEAFCYLPLSNGIRAEEDQSESRKVDFENMPAVVIWKSAQAENAKPATAQGTRVSVTYESDKKRVVTLSDNALDHVEMQVENIEPGTHLEVRLSGRSEYVKSQGTYRTTNLTIDEIIDRTDL